MDVGIDHQAIGVERVRDGIGFADISVCAALEAKERLAFEWYFSGARRKIVQPVACGAPG
jgi:hypothetical protein